MTLLGIFITFRTSISTNLMLCQRSSSTDEPAKSGDGVYFGFGKITTPPTEDKREPGYYFVEVSAYKPFLEPVPFKDQIGRLREADSPHYNAQNAVRRIPSELVDEICLDGKILLNFTADAHLIKVLGEQLIASEKVRHS